MPHKPRLHALGPIVLRVSVIQMMTSDKALKRTLEMSNGIEGSKNYFKEVIES